MLTATQGPFCFDNPKNLLSPKPSLSMWHFRGPAAGENIYRPWGHSGMLSGAGSSGSLCWVGGNRTLTDG